MTKGKTSVKNTVIYRYQKESGQLESDISSMKLTTRWWRPSLCKYIPPGKSKKYLIYWFFHYLRIFRNRDYSALLIYDKNRLISSLLVVPAHFKWPFMQKIDLQFTYVMTDKDHRNQGIAARALKYAINAYNKKGRSFWYVTDTENTASIKLCTKLGFEFQGYGTRQGFINSLQLIC